MSGKRRSSNTVLAGLFVVLSVIGGVAIVIVLAGVGERLTAHDSYVVRFTLADGADGLDIGSAVKIAGRNVGRVSEIELQLQDSPERVAGVYATIQVQSEHVLYGRPRVSLERPLLGSGATLNFASVGRVEEGEASEGTLFEGGPAAPSFLAQAGYGDEQKTQLQTILSKAEKIATNVEVATEELRASIVPDVKSVVSDVRERWPGWGERVDSITANIDEASAKLPDGIEEVRGVVAKAREWFDENRERLTTIVANTETATGDLKEGLARLNEETVDKLHTMLDSGTETAGSARKAIERVDVLVAEQTPNLRKSLADARLAADQLKLTMGEVRRSPWRLLYRPDTKELEFELLYDAARQYAEAVSDLRAAGEAMESAGARATVQGANAEDLTPLVEMMKGSFEKYRAAEEKFLDLVVSPAKKP